MWSESRLCCAAQASSSHLPRKLATALSAEAPGPRIEEGCAAELSLEWSTKWPGTWWKGGERALNTESKTMSTERIRAVGVGT